MRTEQPGHNRRRAWIIAGCVGLLLAGGGTVAWAMTQQIGTPPAPPAATSAPETSESPVSSSSPSEEAPKEPTTAPSPPTAKPLSSSRPTAVRIPSIDVSSQVHDLGLDAQGSLMVPSGKLYNEVAWYNGSPTPGETGPSVLEGHVTGTGLSASVFFELGATKEGDKIEVDREDGTTAVFEVTEVRSYAKADFPKVDVYGSTDGPELRVITCGGDFDKDAGHHVNNVVVYAELIKG